MNKVNLIFPRRLFIIQLSYSIIMSAIANNTTGPETALAKAAAPDTITVGKVIIFNKGESVIVTGTTPNHEIAQVKVWNCKSSDIHVGTKLNLKSVTADSATKDIQEDMVRLWNTKKYPVAGGGLWKCQSAEVDPSGLHFKTCFANIKPNELGIFSGKVETIDTDTVSSTTERGDFEKTIFTITGTEGSECIFSIKSNAETQAVSVGDTVAFFGADHGFAPRLDSVSYAPSITKVIPDTTNTTNMDSDETTPKEETTTTKETTIPKEETTIPKEETTIPKEETKTTKETTTPKEETKTTKDPAETILKEKVLEEAAGVKRQMNDSPPLASLKRSKSTAQ